VVLGNRRDPKSRSDSVIRTPRPGGKHFRGKGVLHQNRSSKRSRLILTRGSVSTMPPKRCVELPLEREMREMCTRLDAMEKAQRRAPDVGDVSEVENEEVEVEEAVVEDATEEHLLRAVLKLGAREKIDIPMYEGNLETKNCLNGYEQ
jgi:hypothetical protein